MNYAISDIHNDKKRLDMMLRKISFGKDDHLYVLGDVFDRSGDDADPIGVYYTLLGLEERCTFILGNHDKWLAEYIKAYFDTSRRKRSTLRPYSYNSFDIMNRRTSQIDMLKVADDILQWPFQISVDIEGEQYLFAHSMTSADRVEKSEDYYLMGTELDFKYLRNGIDGNTSVCGHHPTSTIRKWYGDDNRPKQNEIWHNIKGNVYMIDCGCGFASGRLACLRLEDKVEYYV